jgi:hypothetical protein
MAMLHQTVRKRFGVDGAAFGERSLWIDVNAKIAKTNKRGLASSVRAEQPLHGAHRDPQVSR